MRTLIPIALLIFMVSVLVAIPASTQVPAPDGDFGYDDFDVPLQNYDFWIGATNTVYFVSGSGQLLLNGGGESQLLIHPIFRYTNETIIKIRFNVTVTTPTFVHFKVCGNPGGISVGKPNPFNGYNLSFSPATTCETWAFTGIGGDNTPSDFTTYIRYLRSQDVFLYLYSDPLTLAYMDYFAVECAGVCNKATLATPTLIIKSTGIPRTQTPTAYAPITLIPPPNLDNAGNGDANCGVYQCGTVNLSFPVMPPLDSPTPLSVGVVNRTPTLVALVTPNSGTFVPATPIVSDNGEGNLNDYLYGNGTLIPLDPNTGDPIEVGFNNILPPENNLFIAYIKGVYDTDANYWGIFAPIIQVVLSVGTILFFVLSGRFIMPIVVILISLIRKAWSALMELVPF